MSEPYNVKVTTEDGTPLRIECTPILEPSLGMPYRYTYLVYQKESDELFTPPEIKMGDCVEYNGDLYIVEYLFTAKPSGHLAARISGFISERNMSASKVVVDLKLLTLRYSRSE